jgi:Tfp pilus assembly PilM family ATPase
MAMSLSFEFDNNIKIIEASKNGQTLSVLRCMCIDSSCVKDGKIIDMDGTVNAIYEELKTNRIKTKKAIFVINSSKIMIRTIKLPLLKKSSEILSMIQIELQQIVSAELSKYKIMYEISNVTNENKILYAEYIVYCVPMILVSKYIELAARLKLKLLKIDISPKCINALYKNNIRINDAILNNNEITVFVNVNKNSFSFSAVNNGICGFYTGSNLDKSLTEKTAESVSQYGYFEKEIDFFSKYKYSEIELESFSQQWYPEKLFTAQIAKFMRYYYSVSGNRSIDKIYIYATGNQMLKEAIKSKLNLNCEIIERISNLTVETPPDEFELSKYFNNVLTLFSPGNQLMQNTNRGLKLKNNFGYAAILLIIAAASTVFFGFSNSRAAMKNEMAAMSSYIDDGKNTEIHSVIEGIKNESDYLKLYLQQAEELQRAAAENDYADTKIIREINNLKPFETRVISIYSDKDSTQLMCLSPSTSEAALFFSKLRGIDLVEGANMPSIQSKSGQPFSYYIVLKLKDVKRGR